MAGSRLFKPAAYRRIALANERIPHIPPHEKIEGYQTPADAESASINKVLVRIFNDSDLHAAVRAYGGWIPFAHYVTSDRCYEGFKHLRLDPEKRMVLIRQELQPWADSASETEQKGYALFQTEDGIFYVQERFEGIRKATQPYNEAVLASNDMTGYEFCANFDPKKVLRADQVMKSLEKAVEEIIKGEKR